MDSKLLDEAIKRVERARLEVSKHHIVKIVAASKYVGSSEILELYNSGQRAFGENRVQDLVKKESELEALPLEWHFIGVLQKNKINQLLSINPSLIHSVDSLDLALEIDKRAQKEIDVLLQINSSNEESKSGVDPIRAEDCYLEIKERCKNLRVRGIMSIGALSDDKREVIKGFEKSRAIFENLNRYGATILSMGMSLDYEIAIKCGSNLVRLGSSLFKS